MSNELCVAILLAIVGFAFYIYIKHDDKEK